MESRRAGGTREAYAVCPVLASQLGCNLGGVPLYEYRCACGNRFELLRRLGQDAEGVCCPRCGGSEVEKEYSTFAGAVAGGGASSGDAAACVPRGRFT